MVSTVIRQGMKFAREKRQAGADIKVAPKLQYNDFPAPTQIYEEKTALLVEGEGFGIKKVELSSEQSGFSYFLDGIERKQTLFYLHSIPVIYGYVAGAILKRTDKKMGGSRLELAEEMFYLPLITEPDSPQHYFSKEEAANLGEKVKNIGVKNKEGAYPLLPEQFVQAAHSEIQTQRNNIEAALIESWIGEGNGSWLYVDGRLEKQRKQLIAGANIVGVIKSHHASYFCVDDQYRIYAMEKGERTCVFQPADKNGETEKVYSWYLKLHHDKRQGTNNFGIVRVEVPAEERFIAMVDVISEWIMLETKPIAFPASRWDRMIYPVKYCEDYLKSRAPVF